MTPYLHALEDDTGLPNPPLEPCVVLPMKDEALRYSIGVPTDWQVLTQMGEVVDSPHIQRPIGAFGSGGPPYGQAVAVTMTPLPTEVRLEDWVHRLCVRAEWSVLDQRWHETEHGLRLVTWSAKDRFLRATVAFADCGRVLMTHCMGDIGSQPALATTVWRTALPMHLVTPGGDGRLEARRSHRGEGIVFDLPHSWQASAERGWTSGSLNDWHRRQPVASVRVRVDGDVKQPHAARRQRTVDQLWQAGWRTSRTLSDPGRPAPGFGERWEIRDGEVNLPGGVLSKLRLAHGECEGRAVEVVATCEADRELLWMRTTRAVEIALESLQPNSRPA